MTFLLLKKTTGILATCAALCGLAACGESDQSLKRKTDARASDGPGSAHTVGNWKAGDTAAWEAQIRIRSQGQNEYSRSGSPP
jgi:hypothetical protein